MKLGPEDWLDLAQVAGVDAANQHRSKVSTANPKTPIEPACRPVFPARLGAGFFIGLGFQPDRD
jgi:hypothetical protein